MPDTDLGFLSYGSKGDTPWYDTDDDATSTDGLVQWLNALELLGIPTYSTFGDLPTPGSRPTRSGTNGTQRQFAAVAADRTVYRDDGSEWVPWFGAGTENRRLPGSSYFETVDAQSVQTDSLGTTADHIVSSKDELQSAFNNLSAGDTIWIETPDTPYRTDQWLDIDVSGVTVKAENARADNGERLIKVADGADVGGIRIGYNAAVSDVEIHGVGIDGNAANQSQDIHHKDGVLVADATKVVVDNCDLGHLSPIDRHGVGGDGISVLYDANRVWLKNNRIDDAGDRSIEVAGTNIVVSGNHVTNGYDRGTSLQVQQDPRDGNDYVSQNVIVANNIYDTISDGSAIGFNSGVNGDGRNFAIVGNFAKNTGRLPTIRARVIGLTVVGNVGYQQDGMNIVGDSLNVTIAGNTLIDSTDFGINVGGNADRVNVVGNMIAGPTNAGITTTGGKKVAVRNNFVYQAGGRGIEGSGGQESIVGNTVWRSGDENIAVTGGRRGLVGNNIVKYADQNGNGAPEFLISGQKHLVVGNICNERANTVFAEDGNSLKIQYVGNRGPDALGNMWNIQSAYSWGLGNYPAVFDDEGTVTLSTGASPAARIEGVSSTEGMDLSASVQPDPTSSQPAANYAVETYFEWDDTAGAWDLVIEWRTDPGSDVSAVYEVTREPTSRAVKDA